MATNLEARQLLLDLLASHAYRRLDNPIKLSGGQMSHEYLDCKLALCHPEALDWLGTLVCERLHPSVVTVGGLTMGADPIAVSTSQVSLDTDQPVRWFSVRKQPKRHGLQRLIEGMVQLGEPCAVLEDVITTGESTLQAIRACQAAGFVVQQVLVLVDREEQGGLATLASSAGCPIDRIFTMQEIAARAGELSAAVASTWG